MNGHDCPGLRYCYSHPRWHIWRQNVHDEHGQWRVVSPNLASGKSHHTLPGAFAYATDQARAEKLAAIQDGAA